MRLDEVLATLAGEPWCRLPSDPQVRRLTLRQYYSLVHWPREKETGALIREPRAGEEEMSDEDFRAWWWRTRKLPGWWIERRLREEGA